MNYENRIVCFLDILAFKKQILSSVDKDGTDSTKMIADIVNMLSGIRDILDIDKAEERPGTEITQFSDSVVISFPENTESGVFYVLLYIMWVQIYLVHQGFLCRGGIAHGKLIHTSKLLFGPAFLDAYDLELNVAVYPRVILAKSIIEAGVKAHASYNLPKHEEKSIMSLLEQDCDGMYYINYITGAQSELDDPELDYPNYLFQLQQIIADNIGIESPSIVQKYSWLKEKLDPHLIELKKVAAMRFPDRDILYNAYQSL